MGIAPLREKDVAGDKITERSQIERGQGSPFTKPTTPPKMPDKFRLATRRDWFIITKLSDASVAQLVEHHLAKVNVEGSNPFARSTLIINNLRFKVE